MLTRTEINVLLDALETWTLAAPPARGTELGSERVDPRRLRARRERATLIGAKLIEMRKEARDGK